MEESAPGHTEKQTNKKLIKILKDLHTPKKLPASPDLDEPNGHNNLVKLIMKEGLKTVKSSTKNIISAKLPETDLGLPNFRQIQSEKSFSLFKKQTSSSLTRKEALNSTSAPKLKLQKQTPSLIDAEISAINPAYRPLSPIKKSINSVKRAGYKSLVGLVNGRPKLHSSDSVIIKPSIQNVKGQYLFAVIDGHGAEGHKLSEFIRDRYAAVLEMVLPSDCHVNKVEKALKKGVNNLLTELHEAKLDIIFSGCTMTSVLICGSSLVCANVGNCRAIIGNFNTDWEAVPLTIDHTLENELELNRVLEKGARVESFRDWHSLDLKYFKRAFFANQNSPGLEITRSIGDRVARPIGIKHEPETGTYQLKGDDKFMIIGSSGFWRNMENLEAVNIVAPCWEVNNIQKACDDLFSTSNKKWREKCRDKDDISVIIVFLESQSS